MGNLQILNTTANNKVYKQAQKKLFAGCSYCSWHRGENISHKPKHLSWKKLRSTKYK